MESETQNKLTKKEKRELGRQERRETEVLTQIQKQKNKIKFWIFGIGLPAVIIGGIIFLISKAPSKPKLPPTIAQGHIEQSPKSNISTDPIPDPIQRHVLEHAGGGGKPGIIIQYNCEKYSCDPNLVTKLAELVKKYPDNVYLAPGNYAGKIILTKLGEYKILEEYDEAIITSFIGS